MSIEGTPHLQGFCLLKAKKAFNVVHKALMNSHIEPKARASTYQDQYDYCTKEDRNAWQCGVQPMDKQGTRTDLMEVASRIDAGIETKELASEYPDVYIKFHRGITAYRNAVQRERDISTPPTVIWYFGDTGTGKTRTAYESAVGS